MKKGQYIFDTENGRTGTTASVLTVMSNLRILPVSNGNPSGNETIPTLHLLIPTFGHFLVHSYANYSNNSECDVV